MKLPTGFRIAIMLVTLPAFCVAALLWLFEALILLIPLGAVFDPNAEYRGFPAEGRALLLGVWMLCCLLGLMGYARWLLSFSPKHHARFANRKTALLVSTGLLAFVPLLYMAFMLEVQWVLLAYLALAFVCGIGIVAEVCSPNNSLKADGSDGP